MGLSDSKALLLNLQQQGIHDAGTTVIPTIDIHTTITTALLSILALLLHNPHLFSLLPIPSKSRREYDLT